MTATMPSDLGIIRQAVRNAWQDALGRPGFADDDGFFSVLRGHSLAAIQVMAQLSEEFDARLPVRLIFRNRTVSTLTTAIAEELDRKAGTPKPSDRPQDLIAQEN
jgi:acyl carrier protein